MKFRKGLRTPKPLDLALFMREFRAASARPGAAGLTASQRAAGIRGESE